MVCSKSNRGRYASPALAAASYPFVDLPSGDTLPCKLSPADKFYKIRYLFNRQYSIIKLVTNQELPRERDGVKKLVILVIVLICVLALAVCNNSEEKNINFPFDVGDVENIEMYHYTGAPVSAEKKVVVDESSIKVLYDMFEGLLLKEKKVKENIGANVTSFRFNLSDGTNYELIYICNGVKNGNLKSSTGNFEYFTSADIGSYWNDIELETVSVEEKELPK